MNYSEKKLLWVYFDAFQPIWEITKYRNSKQGLYRITPSFDSICDEDFVLIQRYDGYDWVEDGKASWDFVRKVVEAHRLGRRGCKLAENLRRITYEVVWE